MFPASPYPASLLLGAVGVAVEAGEDGARRHQLTGLVPAVGVAEPGGVTLTLLIQDGVQSGRQGKEITLLSSNLDFWDRGLRSDTRR